MDSLKAYKRIPSSMLRERMETVKELARTELDLYEIAKDTTTGDHYLLFMYLHRNIAEGGHEETYYHLMPIETDDVLDYLFGGAPYLYPDNWTKPYLRNSAEGDGYVWFDPSRFEEAEQYETVGQDIQELLRAFKKDGQTDEASVRRLIDQLDRLGRPDPDKES